MQEYLFCIDSDGCAMDTMTYKHNFFFGPIAAEVFQVTNKEKFLEEWNIINLYSKTRGVNRFVGLVMTLQKVGYVGIDDLIAWTNETTELSNRSLQKEIAKKQSQDLKNALLWSNQVNDAIENSKDLAKPFANVKEGLTYLHRFGKVIIVSSANKEAVESEWQKHGLLSEVDELYCQDQGKKADIIKRQLKEGFEPKKVLMIGDAPGDLMAAQDNGIYFYPILVNHEAASWKNLADVIPSFIKGNYQAIFEQQQQSFWNNLTR